MFDQIKEKLEAWLAEHPLSKDVAELKATVSALATPEAIQTQLEQWGRQLAASLEERFGANLKTLEAKFLPMSFRDELSVDLSKWSAQAFASLEERALGVVKHELELFKSSVLSKLAPTEPASPVPAAVAPSSPEPLAVEAPDTRPLEHIDPLSLARDAFPSLQEFTEIGYYPDTYEHRKAEWEAQKAAVNAPADGATSA